MDTKLFDLHFALGYDSNISIYTTTILFGNHILIEEGGPQILYAINKSIATMLSIRVFYLLRKDPTISYFPFVLSNNNITPLVDIHFEIGIPKTTGIYAKTEFLNGIPSFREVDMSIYETAVGAAISEAFFKMEKCGILSYLMANPQHSVYPIPFTKNPNTNLPLVLHPYPEETKKKEVARRLPSDIIDIPHPACQSVCTSWDIFGKSKCKNICEWRPEV